MTTPFRIALTADFYDDAGTPRYTDFGLNTFEGHDHIVVSKFSEHRAEITSDQLLDTRPLEAISTIPFMRVIRDQVGSNFGYYFGQQSLKRCELTQPMRVMECLEMLRDHAPAEMVN